MLSIWQQNSVVIPREKTWFCIGLQCIGQLPAPMLLLQTVTVYSTRLYNQVKLSVQNQEEIFASSWHPSCSPASVCQVYSTGKGWPGAAGKRSHLQSMDSPEELVVPLAGAHGQDGPKFGRWSYELAFDWVTWRKPRIKMNAVERAAHWQLRDNRVIQSQRRKPFKTNTHKSVRGLFCVKSAFLQRAGHFIHILAYRRLFRKHCKTGKLSITGVPTRESNNQIDNGLLLN